MLNLGKFAQGLLAMVFAATLTATAVAAAAGPAQVARTQPTGLA